MEHKRGEWKSIYIHVKCPDCEAAGLISDYKYGEIGFVYKCGNCDYEHTSIDGIGSSVQSSDYFEVRADSGPDAKDARIAELVALNNNLEIRLEESNRFNLNLRSQQINTENSKRYLQDTIDNLVDRLLRQTIAQKSHGERNQEIRKICSNLLMVLKHIDDDKNDIPF